MSVLTLDQTLPDQASEAELAAKRAELTDPCAVRLTATQRSSMATALKRWGTMTPNQLRWNSEHETYYHTERRAWFDRVASRLVSRGYSCLNEVPEAEYYGIAHL